jgi:hypothetical protein
VSDPAAVELHRRLSERFEEEANLLFVQVLNLSAVAVGSVRLNIGVTCVQRLATGAA